MAGLNQIQRSDSSGYKWYVDDSRHLVI